MSYPLCYTIRMTIKEKMKEFPAGTKIVHRRNPMFKGTVVGSAFGTPENKGNVRVHLINGLVVDVTPYALKKVNR